MSLLSERPTNERLIVDYFQPYLPNTNPAYVMYDEAVDMYIDLKKNGYSPVANIFMSDDIPEAAIRQYDVTHWLNNGYYLIPKDVVRVVPGPVTNTSGDINPAFIALYAESRF